MSKTVYYTASSLDGYIVDADNSLDWLTSRAIDADGPFGIDEFMASIGAMVMGSATYEWILKHEPGEWMYASHPSWVLTHRPEIIADGHIHVYGALRGRAIAGATGDASARIFVGRLEAELVSIAGRYLVHEDIAPAHLGQRVQIVLQEQRVVIMGSG